MQLTLYKRCTIKKEINKCSKFFVAQKAVVNVFRAYWPVVVSVSQDIVVLISGPVRFNAFSIAKAHISSVSDRRQTSFVLSTVSRQLKRIPIA